MHWRLKDALQLPQHSNEKELKRRQRALAIAAAFWARKTLRKCRHHASTVSKISYHKIPHLIVSHNSSSKELSRLLDCSSLRLVKLFFMQTGSAAFHELSGDSTLQWAREKWRWNKESDLITYAAYAPLFSLDSLAHMVHCLSWSRRDCELYHTKLRPRLFRWLLFFSALAANCQGGELQNEISVRRSQKPAQSCRTIYCSYQTTL